MGFQQRALSAGGQRVQTRRDFSGGSLEENRHDGSAILAWAYLQIAVMRPGDGAGNRQAEARATGLAGA